MATEQQHAGTALRHAARFKRQVPGSNKSVVMEMEATLQDVITAEDAAKMLGVHTGTLRNWRRMGRGPRIVRYGPRAIRYIRADVQAFLQSCAVQVGADR